MSLTRTELVARVQRLLGDYSTAGVSTMTSDGSTKTMPLRDRFIDPATMVLTVTAEEVMTTLLATDYVLDVDYPQLTLDTAAEMDAVVLAVYRYRHWAEEDIIIWLNQTLSDLSREFYVHGSVEISADGSVEYEIDDGGDEPPLRVTTVSWADDSENYQRLSSSSWRIERDELDAATIVVYSKPQSGTLRVRYTKRPESFADGETTLADLGLPERLAQPLVLYTAFMLLEQAIIPRMRADYAVATQGEGVVRVSSLLQHAAHLRALADLEVQRTRMRPPTAIGI